MEDREIQLSELIHSSMNESAEGIKSYSVALHLPENNISIAKEVLFRSFLSTFGHSLRIFIDILSLYK